MTLPGPDTADADDAATLVAVAADPTALRGVIHVALTSLHPDEVDSPTDPTLSALSAPHPTHTAGHRTDPT